MYPYPGFQIPEASAVPHAFESWASPAVPSSTGGGPGMAGMAGVRGTADVVGAADKTDVADVAGHEPAAGSSANLRAEWLSRLLDARHRFPAHENPALCRWLAAALPGCRSWPSEVTLQWEEAADRPATPAPWRPGPAGELMLRLGPCARVHEGYLRQGVLATWEIAGAAPGSMAPSFTAPPGDLFDALANALAQRQAARVGTPASPALLTGMTLRRELADQMRTPGGRQIPLPVTATDAAPPPFLGPLHWMTADADRVGSEMAAVMREDLRTLQATPAPPPSGADPLAQVIHILRHGGWCPALDHLVPTLMVRLALPNKFRRPAISVCHEGHMTYYGRQTGSPYEARLYRQSTGLLQRRNGRASMEDCPPGPNSFLEAAAGICPGSLDELYPGIRNQLAALMEANLQLMRLRLALFERGFTHDQELLLRLCLVNGELTAAGRQVMDASLPQRAVTPADLQRWFDPATSAMLRSPEAIAEQGISVIDAHFLAGPLRPTAAGNLLRGRPPRAGSVLQQPDQNELLRLGLPRLLYAYRTLPRVACYIRTSESQLRNRLSAEHLDAAKRFAAKADEAERLVMPLQSVPPIVRPEPDPSAG